MDFQQNYQQRIESVLDSMLIPKEPHHLCEAMRYAVLGGGKRIRALLVYAAGKALNIEDKNLDIAAAAIELIHAYSLIHDDLPCMDDDDLRRGKPTVHKAFDEATAVLAGDALQTKAFQILSEPSENFCAENQLKILEILTKASGCSGMVKGQAIDLAAVGQSLNEDELENMHNHKTGALIKASVLMASYCKSTQTSEHDEEQRASFAKYAESIGLAFQVRDDILDIQSDTETLGKQQGADIAAGKPSYPLIVGMSAAKEKLFNLHENALKSLNGFGDEADPLRDIAAFIVKRVA